MRSTHEAIPGQVRARPPPPQSFVQFSDRGCRRPPRSRGLDSGYLWKRNAAVQPTHTTPISRYRQHMSTIVKHLFRSGSKKCSPPDRNPCSPSFGTTVHDQWNCCSCRTLRLRVAFDPQFLYPPESGAQVIPIVRFDVLLVQFGKHGLEVTKAANRAVILVVAPGRVLANTSQQDNLLDALQQNPTLEPASCQDFVGGRERRLYAGPSLEQFLDRGDEGVRGVVEHFLFTLLVVY